MMKFAVFLVCSLVAVQGFQANPEKFGDLRSVETIKEIQDILEQIRTIVNELQKEIPQVIQGIRDNVKETIEQAEEIANEIRERIEGIAQITEDIGRKCVGAQEDEIKALGEFASEGMKACTKDALAQIEPLTKKVNDLVNEANNLRDDIIARTLQCIEKNPITAVLCMKRQIEPIRSQMLNLQEQVLETITLFTNTAVQVPTNLANCVISLQLEIATRERAILKNIAECIVDSVDSNESENQL